jgi:carnosine synthase
MGKAGLPTPKHYKIMTAEDVPLAGAHVGFPAVIKPISGAASIGVIRCNNEDDLAKAYQRYPMDQN